MAAALEAGRAGAPHVPVMLDEVIAASHPLEGATVIDGTYGAGGYSRAMLAAGAGQVFGVDRDPEALAAAGGAGVHGKLTLVKGTFGALDEVAEIPVDVVVLDIGVSSMQLDQGARGFSFLRDGPLDMRMSSEGVTAGDVVNRASAEELADIVYHFGEDRAARRIAKAIVAARKTGPIETTTGLATIVEACLPKARPGQAHPATRTFQALRIAVNDELGELVRGLSAAERVLAPGGRLVVVTFHSLEDRIVKRYLAMASAETSGGSRHSPDRVLPTPRFEKPRKALSPGAVEIDRNPRARSARLRSAVRTVAQPVALEARTLGLPAAPLAGEITGRART